MTNPCLAGGFKGGDFELPHIKQNRQMSESELKFNLEAQAEVGKLLYFK